MEIVLAPRVLSSREPPSAARTAMARRKFIGIYLQLAGRGLPNFDLITGNTRAYPTAARRLYLHSAAVSELLNVRVPRNIREEPRKSNTARTACFVDDALASFFSSSLLVKNRNFSAIRRSNSNYFNLSHREMKYFARTSQKRGDNLRAAIKNFVFINRWKDRCDFSFKNRTMRINNLLILKLRQSTEQFGYYF